MVAPFLPLPSMVLVTLPEPPAPSPCPALCLSGFSALIIPISGSLLLPQGISSYRSADSRGDGTRKIGFFCKALSALFPGGFAGLAVPLVLPNFHELSLHPR